MKKILIVEDDSFLKNLESSKLTQSGFEVASATSKKEVDTALETASPDIILLDLMLPDVNGFDLLTTFKADDKLKSIPVIVFSNLSDDVEMKRVMDAGASAYMVKSNFTLDDVIEKITSIIGA